MELSNHVCKTAVWNLAPPILYTASRYRQVQPSSAKFSSMFSNSEISLTTTTDKFLLKKSLDIIETWAPVFHSTSNEWPLISPLTVHLFPTNPTTMACCRGVRWLTKVLSLRSRVFGSALFDRCEIAVHGTLWSSQCFFLQARLQYFTILHSEHRNNFTLSNWTWPQPLHWWDL